MMRHAAKAACRTARLSSNVSQTEATPASATGRPENLRCMRLRFGIRMLALGRMVVAGPRKEGWLCAQRYLTRSLGLGRQARAPHRRSPLALCSPTHGCKRCYASWRPQARRLGQHRGQGSRWHMSCGRAAHVGNVGRHVQARAVRAWSSVSAVANTPIAVLCCSARGAVSQGRRCWLTPRSSRGATALRRDAPWFILRLTAQCRSTSAQLER